MTTTYATQQELETALAALNLTDEGQKAQVVCALIGHSRIKSACLGYYSCGRCSAQVGDALGGAYSPAADVVIGHNCPTCRENYAACTWRDKFMVPDPFKAEEQTL